MLVRPGRVTPGRPLPAALLFVLGALASLVGSPAAAAEAPTVARSVVGDTGPALQRLVPRPARPAKWTGQAARLAVVGRSTSTVHSVRRSTDRSAAAARVVADRVSIGGAPAAAPAVLGALVVLALTALGLAQRRGRWPSSGRTPGGHRGRAPPAYAIA